MAFQVAIPDFRLSVDGRDLRGEIYVPDFVDTTDKVRPRLISLTLNDKRAGEADQLDIVLDDSDGKLDLPKKGALVKLQLGWKQGSEVITGLVDKGSFTVDDIEWGGPPDQVTIRARSADLTAGFRARREKGWRDTTLGAIARDVARRQGLEAKVAPALAGVEVKILAQHQTSDMALLRRLGCEHDAVATVKDRKLILAPIGAGASAGGKALPGATVTRGQVSDYRYREVDRSADAGVEARWHDQATGERKTVTIGGGSGKPRRLRRIYNSEADARAATKAEAGRARRAEAEFETSLAHGRPDLYPERGVKLSGFKPQADAQRWLIVELTHTLDASGLTTRLKLETAA